MVGAKDKGQNLPHGLLRSQYILNIQRQAACLFMILQINRMNDQISFKIRYRISRMGFVGFNIRYQISRMGFVDFLPSE